ncbi:hypothetical protein SDJN03_29950, partial [Cucurbita argyrosperma subsp. sororia]
MDSLTNLHLCFLAAALLSATAHGYAVVTGTVFCDQCKDGQISMFDYPINGVKVMVACGDGNGGVTYLREETTNLFGSFTMRFDGMPDLSGCYATVGGTGEGATTDCGGAGSPPRSLRLMFRLFSMEMYVVDSLLSQPAQPMSFCSASVHPVPVPVVMPPPPNLPPPFKMPPLPQLPPLPPLPQLPPMPFLEASACQHENWTNPYYKCYWRAVNPDMKVGVVFGVLAANRYGTDLTLWNGLQGRGDPYRTLLREAITAFLNSYNSVHFPYPALSVVEGLNWALLGSQRAVLHTALRFKRANSGNGHVTCKFDPCQ